MKMGLNIILVISIVIASATVNVAHSQVFTVCFEENVDYFGNDHGEGIDNVETPELCQELCQIKDGCFYWTYIPAAKDCHLKNNSNGRTHKNGTVSGPKFCPGSENENDSLYDGDCVAAYDVDYFGNDLGAGIGNVTQEMCKMICTIMEGCFHWTYIPEREDCHLKKNSKGRTPMKGAVSGPKFCAPCEEDSECSIDGSSKCTTYDGGSFCECRNGCQDGIEGKTCDC